MRGGDEAHGAGSVWRPRGFVERVGAALLAPRRALAAADDPDAAGRSNGDALALLGIAFVAVWLRELVAAGWLAVTSGVGLGARVVVDALTEALAVELGFVLVAGLVLTIAAGRRRSFGRDFDLACVALIPVVAVELCATLVVIASGVSAEAVRGPVTVAAFGWGAAVVCLAWEQARTREAPR